ncbi:MAG: PIN domain-containing protein [Nocardioidaceae bacterium]|nr:PIN domain-containing protein [Nocardioidaceae bacterium]
MPSTRTDLHLLDANVLIALTVAEHEHHRRVARWIAGTERIALCPVVEGALVRFLVRIGETAATAQEVLRLHHQDPRCELWPDTISYADVALGHVRGHRQVTDAYLASLAASRGARLATLDTTLARELPSQTFLVPAS